MWNNQSLCALVLSLGVIISVSLPARAETKAPMPTDRNATFKFAQASPSSAALTGEKDTIHKVVSDYYDAVGRDPVEAAAFYGEPAMIVLPTEVITLNKRTDAEAFLAKLLGALKPLGYSYSKLSDPRIKLLSGTTAIYSTVATRYKNDGSELQRAGFTYLLLKDASGWKIHGVLATDLDKLISAD